MSLGFLIPNLAASPLARAPLGASPGPPPAFPISDDNTILPSRHSSLTHITPVLLSVALHLALLSLFLLPTFCRSNATSLIQALILPQSPQQTPNWS